MSPGGLVHQPDEFESIVDSLLRDADPAQFPVVGRSSRMSLGRLAASLGVSPDHLRKIVKGRAPVSLEMIELIDEKFALRGRGVVRTRLYLTALGHVPTRVRAEEKAVSEPLERLAEAALVFDHSSYPLYISGPTWDIVYFNKEFDRWWPTAKTAGNIMRAIMNDPAIRATLIDWEDGWVAPVITQMRAALTLMPEIYHGVLTSLIREVTGAEQVVRHMWLTKPILETHGDGSERTAYCPHGNPCNLHLQSYSLEGLPLHRLVVMLPLGPHPCCYPEAES
jgi:hypothetical protein